MDDKVPEPKRPSHGSKGSSLLEIIFGPHVTDVMNESNEFPESTLVRAIDLKIEQERTKQQYYKLANMDKCLEMLKFAKGYGVPPQHLVHLVNNDVSIPSNNNNNENKNKNNNSSKQVKTPTALEGSNNKGDGSAITSTFNSPYKFPATKPLKATNSNSAGGNNSNNSNTGNTGNGSQPERRTYHRRTNSPARIGANAVATLSDSISIKEEELSDLDYPPKSKISIPMNRTNSGPNTHNRNLSLPTMNKFLNTSIPTNMTSILNFDDDATESNTSTRNSPVSSKRPSIVVNNNNNNNNTNNNNSTDNSPIHKNVPLVGASENVLKRSLPITTPNANNIHKKVHRRTRSATVIPSFGVIDLNVIDQRNNESRGHTPNIINNINNNNDTCSESSSTKGNDSPIMISLYQQQPLQHKYQSSNSVNRLLND